MKVLLAIPNNMGRYYKPATPHVGIGYLAANLLKFGHEVKIVDLRVEDNPKIILKSLKTFKPDLIGISSSSSRYQTTYDLIKEIKKRTKIPIILGGAHASTVQEQILKDCPVDYVCVGEGEHLLLELLAGKKLSLIDGLIWRKGKKIIKNQPRKWNFNLDELPYPGYDLFPLNKYLEKKIPIVTARGCPHGCVYCAVKLIAGRTYRTRSPQNVVGEIQYWFNRGYRLFGFNDDTFTENLKRAEEICDLIIKSGMKISWELRTGIRVDRISEKLLQKMKKAGCFFFAYGIESGNQRVLDLMKKGIALSQIKQAVKMAHKQGIDVSGFFMIGTPGDTFKTFLDSYKLAKSLNLNEVRFYNTEPYPGTELFDYVREHGRFLVPPEIYLNEFSRLDEEPIFETEEFPSRLRRKAYNLGEQLIVAALLKKTLGNNLGNFATFFCRYKPIRKFVLKTGFRFTPLIRKVMLKREHVEI